MKTIENHPKFERTLVIIKPDGIQRNLIGGDYSKVREGWLEIGGYEDANGHRRHDRAALHIGSRVAQDYRRENYQGIR